MHAYRKIIIIPVYGCGWCLAVGLQISLSMSICYKLFHKCMDQVAGWGVMPHCPPANCPTHLRRLTITILPPFVASIERVTRADDVNEEPRPYILTLLVYNTIIASLFFVSVCLSVCHASSTHLPVDLMRMRWILIGSHGAHGGIVYSLLELNC